jgi:N-sulfoglucosamine sulfohydrolase
MRPLAALLFFLGGLVSPAPAAEPARRNVLLLVADDLGRDLGCYGNARIKTPHLDALAKRGVRFTHAFATVSSCSPSRASLYTGLYTHTSGQYGLAHAAHNQHTRPQVKSLPHWLRAAGYRTGILGKIHVLPRSVYPFDVEITKNLGGNRNVAVMAREAGRFFADAGSKPFFLVVGFSDPHRSAKGFGNEQTYRGVPETRYSPRDVLVPSFLPDEPEVRQELAEYYQAASRLDRGVGLVLDALKRAGKADNTLVLFLSDNGIPFPGAKTTLYDPGLHLPLIIASPTQKRRGLANHALASWVDVAPTVLDWAGVKKPAALPGRSLLPILEEENPKGWDVVYGSHQFHEITMYYPMRMIRTRQNKYILNLAHPLDYPFASDLYNSKTWQGVLRRKDEKLGPRSVAAYVHRPREELYDLKQDPHEVKNLAGDRKYAGVLTDLRKRLKGWQQKTNDPWLVKYRYE